MSHFTRIWKDYTIASGYISGASMRDLDENTYKSINGDDGGIWTPSSPIIIAGKGVAVVAEWRGNGSGFDITTSAGNPISFEAGSDVDYFGFEEGHEGRTPTVTTTLQRALSTEFYFFDAFFASGDNARYNVAPVNFYPHFTDGIDPGYEIALAAQGAYEDIAPNFVHPLNVYNGGKLESVTLYFSVDQTTLVPNTLPTFMPRYRVIAVSKDGEITPLRIASDTDENGYLIVASPATGSAWYNSGNQQSSVYTCTEDHVIDTSEYSYFIEIYAQYPAQNADYSSDSFHSAVAQFSNVEILDGRS